VKPETRRDETGPMPIGDLTEAIFALMRSEERFRLLTEALPGICWTANADGVLDHIGAGIAATGDESTDANLGRGRLEIVHPDDRPRVERTWRACVASGEGYEVEFRVRTPEGTYRRQRVRASPRRDAAGDVVRWVGVNLDVDDRRRADDARERFVRVIENSDDFIGIADEAGRVTYVNAAGRKLLNVGTLEDARATHVLEYFLPENRAFVESEILPTVARDGRRRGDFRLRDFATGEAVPVSYNVFALTNEAGEPAGIAIVTRDLRERLRMEDGFRALAETGAVMFDSLDYEQTLQNVAAAVTRSFATYCIVDMRAEDGSSRLVAAAHRDPARADALAAIAARRDLRDGHPVRRAARDGASTLLARLTQAHAPSADEERDLAPRSMLCVPVRTSESGTTVGALTFVRDACDARGAYTPDDLRFAEEIALRAGLAFDHARAYGRERRIAATLQAASLPKLLPKIDHLYLSAEYRPGSSEATIGGDWYDAFLLDDGRVAITVGDVMGNGLEAAVTMGKIRQTMQAAAMVRAEPNVMLDVADRTVRDQSADTYATAHAGIYDPVRHEYAFASAGHPGPALRYPDGRIEELVMPGLLLGMRPPGATETLTIAMPPGCALVFFTDGLVEATRDIDEGHRRLHAAMAEAAVAEADNPAQALVEHVLDGREGSDDIAVLIAEVGPSSRFDALLRTAVQRAEDSDGASASGASERA